jgi:hypothetical protein
MAMPLFGTSIPLARYQRESDDEDEAAEKSLSGEALKPILIQKSKSVDEKTITAASNEAKRPTAGSSPREINVNAGSKKLDQLTVKSRTTYGYWAVWKGQNVPKNYQSAIPSWFTGNPNIRRDIWTTIL